jgi:uncharacterized protein (DUF58 family)
VHREFRPCGPLTNAIGSLRTALSGLTVRGRSLIAAGSACLCSSVALGELDLLRVGVLLLALPLGATAVLAGTRLKLNCTRTLAPRRVSAGALVHVSMRIENAARTATPVMFAEDLVLSDDGTAALRQQENWTSTPRFALDRLESGETRTLSYTLRPPRRGSYAVGPLAVRLCDPFGFCELPRIFHAVDRLLVTPEVVSLPRLDPAGRWHAGASVPSGGASGSGEDDIGTRPYRLGDELRRVHWRTTARVGELSVRREEQPRSGSVTLVLDTRASSWPPTQVAAGDLGPVPGFETAVSVTASIAVSVAASGSGLRLTTLDGVELAVMPGGRWSSSADVGAVLEVLADVTLGPGSASPGPTGRAGGSGTAPSGDFRIAVLGRTGPADLEILPPSAGGPGVALLIGPEAGSASTTGAGATALANAGWRVRRVPTLSALPLAWQLLSTGADAAGRHTPS